MRFTFPLPPLTRNITFLFFYETFNRLVYYIVFTVKLSLKFLIVTESV